MRKQFSSSLKLKIALEAIKSDLTISEIVSKYDVSPAQIHRWKRHLQNEGIKIFDSKSQSKPSHDQEIITLHANIGRLTVENNFLERALGRVK
jgi:transposase